MYCYGCSTYRYRHHCTARAAASSCSNVRPREPVRLLLRQLLLPPYDYIHCTARVATATTTTARAVAAGPPAMSAAWPAAACPAGPGWGRTARCSRRRWPHRQPPAAWPAGAPAPLQLLLRPPTRYCHPYWPAGVPAPLPLQLPPGPPTRCCCYSRYCHPCRPRPHWVWCATQQTRCCHCCRYCQPCWPGSQQMVRGANLQY